jgi:hypothetical protein
LPPRPRVRPFNLGPTLDQGRTSTCVGHAARDKIASAPLMYASDLAHLLAQDGEAGAALEIKVREG